MAGLVPIPRDTHAQGDHRKGGDGLAQADDVHHRG